MLACGLFPENLRDLMLSLKANKRQILVYLEIPSAMPVLLGGLRIGATLPVVGAMVGEFVGAKHGLGFLINVGRGQYDTALVFVAILTLMAMALSLYGIVLLAGKTTVEVAQPANAGRTLSDLSRRIIYIDRRSC